MRGEKLTPALIRLAYEQGAFPMGDPETGEVDFYVPRYRALFPIDGIRVSRSLAKIIRHADFEIRFDHAFEDVMRGCLRPSDNWITKDLIRVYVEIHSQGWAHSCEAWQDGRLVGGVYGVAIGGCFSADSMFHTTANASKVALWAIVERCRKLGFTVFDAQVMNPHLARLGACEVTQADYLRRLRHARRVPTIWDTWPLP